MFPGILRWMTLGAVLALVLGLVSACADDDEDDGDDLRPITATPTAVVGLPEDIAQVTLIIENGEFDQDSLDAIAEQPVLLTMVNRDDETYTFSVDELIEETTIEPAAETPVNFNAPNEGEFEGELTGPDGNEIDTIFFNVTGPGGT